MGSLAGRIRKTVPHNCFLIDSDYLCFYYQLRYTNIMLRFFRIGLALAIATIAIAGATSCSKSEFEGPILINDPVNLKRTFTINPGESVTLTSKFDVPESLNYEWSIDGAKTSVSEGSYVFTTNESGSYIITQRVFNGYGEAFIDYYVVVRGTYDKGTFLLNNNTTEASLTYISKDLTAVDENAYATANPGKTLGAKIVSAQAYLGKFYIISQTEGLIVLNSITLKELGRIALPAKANYFLGIDRTTALLSTDDGIYRINLNPLSVGEKIPGFGGRAGMMANTPNYVLALTLENGVVAVDKSRLIVSKVLRVGRSGLAADISGNVWTSHKDTLFKISPSLYVSSYRMPTGITVTSSWNPWNEGSLCISTSENALFFIRANSDGRPSREIYKVNINTISSSSPVLSTLPEGRAFSGIGLRIDNENNIVASTVSTTGDNPEVVVYRAADASLVKTIPTASTDTRSMLFNSVK